MKYLLCGLLVILSACSGEPQSTALPQSISGDIMGAEAGLNLQGASSGGGLFNDTYASETLDLVKSSLAQIIKNTSEEAFTELPEGKRKEWMVSIIERIEIRDVQEYNYDRPVRFHYDIDEEVIYATKYFVNTFPYGRFFTRGVKENSRILIEVYLDILHELSHFYGIGTTEETDVNSEYWAIDFMKNGVDELYACKLIDSENNLDKLFIIQATTGMVKEFYDTEDIEYAFNDSSYLFPFIIDDSSTAEKSNQWGILFNTHLSLGVKNSGQTLEGSLYRDFEPESEEYMGDFFNGFFASNYEAESSDQITVREDQEEEAYISSNDIRNVVLDEVERMESNSFELYGGFVNRENYEGFTQWSADTESVMGIPNVSGEGRNDIKVIDNHSFKINKDLSAFYVGSFEISESETLTSEQRDLFYEYYPEVTHEFKCEHKLSKINVSQYLGEAVDLGAIK